MIVADSSVWIDFFRDERNPATETIRTIAKPSQLLIGDVVLLEVLRGARDEAQADKMQSVFARFASESFLTPALAVSAARNDRLLRSKGATTRKAIDLIIGTFCIERGHVLLHNDRDFLPMVEHLGLRTL